MTPTEIARAAHEVNRAYCESIGDSSIPGWDAAPDWQRQSAINAVEFHHKHPDVTPAASHANWLTFKLRDGWTYGPVKDVDKKEHPCMVDYDELPQEQRTKDYLFRAVVHSLS